MVSPCSFVALMLAAGALVVYESTAAAATTTTTTTTSATTKAAAATTTILRAATTSTTTSVVTNSSKAAFAAAAAVTERSSIGGRIVGGTEASQGEFQFFVKWNDCGASLIHSDMILSAAHCSEDESDTVLVGAYKDQSTKGGAQYRKMTARRVHPHYNGVNNNYDLMVMRLDRSVPFDPIKLNSNPRSPVSDELLTVIGFGDTSGFYASPSTTLMKVDVNYINATYCDQLLGYQLNSSLELCAGDLEGGKDSCYGDSGGPIFNSNNVQVGIVSYADSLNCAEPNAPAVYARISGAIGWIRQQICELSSNPPTYCSKRARVSPTATAQPTTLPPTKAPVRRRSISPVRRTAVHA